LHEQAPLLHDSPAWHCVLPHTQRPTVSAQRVLGPLPHCWLDWQPQRMSMH